ncbi:mitochondrial fission process protein 1 [Diachasmimorpha longicaudata]|uniref:mitochondrial fission process protein 1 n=1 Tax=Diachasmimorpha longicaudata TaxID=58733 RepID=UPI0030B8DF26
MKEGKEIDVYRDTSLRYLGYTNEVGEAFRSLIPKSIVWLSYAIASGYVLADTIHKGSREYSKESGEGKNKRVLLSATDTLIWQSFASVIIPGLVINRICAGVRFLQRPATSIVMKSPWLTTAVGLASIPLIIRPIDRAVEDAMDLTIRQWIGYHPHENRED